MSIFKFQGIDGRPVFVNARAIAAVRTVRDLDNGRPLGGCLVVMAGSSEGIRSREDVAAVGKRWIDNLER